MYHVHTHRVPIMILMYQCVCNDNVYEYFSKQFSELSIQNSVSIELTPPY